TRVLCERPFFCGISACTVTWPATTSFKTAPGIESGCQMGTVTGSHHDGASMTPPKPGTWQVVPPAALPTCPSASVWTPSMRRQMLLSCVMPPGLGRMKRCSSVTDFWTPEKIEGFEYSTQVQINRSMRPPGIQLSRAVND